jgi:biopolymer transport protein ExbB/TolQ
MTDRPTVDLCPVCRRKLSKVLDVALSREVDRLEHRLLFLATIGATAPFIGLFGTVWGIMNAFEGIGRMGSASLAVVAPGISEALIATAMGLFAAIPAAMFYNFFQRRLDEEEAELAGFRLELLNLLEAYVFPDLERSGAADAPDDSRTDDAHGGSGRPTQETPR